ncbi:MAG TPA: hypothetical protein VFK19_02245 [Sphingomicrobium sp.]|nr:hypothetical protein [Sphingomicrobium sp.]
MGLLGRLTGWDAQKEAHNAVVASHFVDHADTDTKRRLIECIIKIQHEVKGRYAGSKDEILADLNRQPRSVQMNLVALACNNLGVQPNVRGFQFNDVSNPYRAKDGDIDERIEFAVRWLNERFPAKVSWPGNSCRVNFTDWLQGISTVEFECPSCSQRLRAPGGGHLQITCPVCKHSWTQST